MWMALCQFFGFMIGQQGSSNLKEGDEWLNKLLPKEKPQWFLGFSLTEKENFWRKKKRY